MIRRGRVRSPARSQPTRRSGPLPPGNITSFNLTLFEPMGIAALNNEKGSVSFISSGALITTTPTELEFNFGSDGRSVNCGHFTELFGEIINIHAAAEYWICRFINNSNEIAYAEKTWKRAAPTKSLILD